MPGTITTITASKLNSDLASKENIQLIDVRTPLEFDSEHISLSKNIPLEDLANRGGEIKKDNIVVLICRTGNRAGRAAGLLSSYGENVSVLEGGISAWKKAGLALIEGKKRLSLERQVQLTIGLILLGSFILGWTVHYAWFVMSALIGCGLTFAGLTGNCGLAILLSRAPWNKMETGSKDKSTCTSN